MAFRPEKSSSRKTKPEKAKRLIGGLKSLVKKSRAKSKSEELAKLQRSEAGKKGAQAKKDKKEAKTKGLDAMTKKAPMGKKAAEEKIFSPTAKKAKDILDKQSSARGVSKVEGEGVKTTKGRKGGEGISSRRKSETKSDTKSKKNLPAKVKNIEKTLGRKLTKKEIAGLVSAGLLTTGTASLLSPVKAKDKTTEGKKKTTPKTETEIRGKKRRVGKFAPRFRPFKGKLAKILLGEDEQFGGGKGGLLDPNLGMGVRRGGRSVATTTTTKDKDGNVISKNTKIKRLNPEVSAKKDRKDPPKKNMGGMMKAKGKAMGGMMKKKGYAMGGSANLKKAGADQEGLKKLPTAVRNKMGYMNEGGDATQESAKQAKMMDRLISKMASEYGMSEEKFKKRLNAIKQKEGPRKTKKPTKAQGAAMSKGANYMPKTRKGYAKGDMPKKKGYAKGGMAKKGYSKGGAVRKSKRGMGAANRGGGAIMR